MTTIIVTHEDNEVEEFNFDPDQRAISLGRRTVNDVCIPDLSVSGKHATITLQDRQAIIEDLNSTNGTYVNGQIVQRTAIHAGDEIILGKVLLSYAAADSQDELLTRVKTDSSRDHTAEKDSATDEKVAETAGATEQAANETGVGSESAAQEAAGTTSSEQHDAASDSEHAHPLEGIEHLVVPNSKPTVTPMHELDSPSDNSKGAVIEIKNGAKSGQILPIDKPVTTLGRPGIQIAAIMRKPDGYFLMHIESDGNIDRPTLNSDSIGDEPVLLHSGDALTVAGIQVEFMLS